MKRAILSALAVLAIALSTTAGAQQSLDLKGLLDAGQAEPSLLLAAKKDADKCNNKCVDKYDYCREENPDKVCLPALEACKEKCSKQ